MAVLVRSSTEKSDAPDSPQRPLANSSRLRRVCVSSVM